MGNANAVKVGPGTLYRAPLGTTEPTSISGAWPAGWEKIGFTDNGSTFSYNPTTANVEVEESYYPIRIVTTGIVATLAFAMAELTAKNLLMALNTDAATSQTTLGDGTLAVEPPGIGNEKRIMLGWDALSTENVANADPYQRLICRQCYQTGTIAPIHQKGNNKTVWAVTFNLELPATGLQPFRHLFPSTLAA